MNLLKGLIPFVAAQTLQSAHVEFWSSHHGATILFGAVVFGIAVSAELTLESKVRYPSVVTFTLVYVFPKKLKLKPIGVVLALVSAAGKLSAVPKALISSHSLLMLK